MAKRRQHKKVKTRSITKKELLKYFEFAQETIINLKEWLPSEDGTITENYKELQIIWKDIHKVLYYSPLKIQVD